MVSLLTHICVTRPQWVNAKPIVGIKVILLISKHYKARCLNILGIIMWQIKHIYMHSGWIYGNDFGYHAIHNWTNACNILVLCFVLIIVRVSIRFRQFICLYSLGLRRQSWGHHKFAQLPVISRYHNKAWMLSIIIREYPRPRGYCFPKGIQPSRWYFLNDFYISQLWIFHGQVITMNAT